MEHTAKCKELREKQAAFIKKHPKACKTCGGYGSWSTPGSFHNPPDGGPCPGCVEEGKCPMCASKINFVEHDYCDYGYCPKCKWDEWAISKGKQKEDTYPDFSCEDAGCFDPYPY